MGCQLAAQSIVEAGLEQYYLDRSEINRTASLPTELTRLEVYDHDEIKSQFVYAQEGMSVAELSVNNLRCAACTWLIESRLDELDGISKCQVNLTNQRMRVIWHEDKLPISRILAVINEIGYDGALTIEREIPQDPERQKAEIGQAIELLTRLRGEILG